MLVLERHNGILSLLNTNGSARVSELARRFHVTEETIRRDLDKLEGSGKLRRSHGGAVPLGTEEQPYWQRETTHEAEKIMIAQEAARRVGPGDRILLDASTSAWHMACRLPNVPVTVVTNSMRVSMTLATQDRIEVISVGGQLLRASLSWVGSDTERLLGTYHVDTLFLSCTGVDVERGLTEISTPQAGVRRAMINQADRRILLADHSKFGQRSLAAVSGLDRIDEVITDAATDSHVVNAIRKRGIQLTVVHEMEQHDDKG